MSTKVDNKTALNDTDSKIEKLLIDKLRAMSLSEKATRFANLQNTARLFALNGIKARHPGISEYELKCRFAAITLGAEFTKRYYQWDPSIKGY